MELIIMQISLSSYYFHILASKYFLQRPVFNILNLHSSLESETNVHTHKIQSAKS